MNCGMFPATLRSRFTRSSRTELQGATVDGTRGIAYPREVQALEVFLHGASAVPAGASHPAAMAGGMRGLGLFHYVQAAAV